MKIKNRCTLILTVKYTKHKFEKRAIRSKVLEVEALSCHCPNIEKITVKQR